MVGHLATVFRVTYHSPHCGAIGSCKIVKIFLAFRNFLVLFPASSRLAWENACVISGRVRPFRKRALATLYPRCATDPFRWCTMGVLKNI